MLVDGLKLFEGSSISNASVETGTTFPTTANAGELFFKTTDNLLYVYNGSAWTSAGSGGGSSAASALTGTILASNVVSSSLTSVGTLGSLVVTGTASAGSFYGAGTGLTGTAAGLSIGGNAATASAVAASALTGTTLASGVVSSSLTSVGTLGSLVVTGGVTASSFSGPLTGNATTASTLATPRLINGVSFNGSADITITSIAAAGTLTGTTLASNVVSSSLTSVGTLGSLTVTGNVTAADPTVSTHLATKSYVDAAINGLTWKNAVRAATTGLITLSGTQTIDGVALVAGDRVLVKNQTTFATAAQNGIYVVAAGAWTRSTDMDGAPSVGEVNGAAVYVIAGTTNASTSWTQTATITTVGTESMEFAQFAAGGTTNASTLLGTTLASNVVSSSLTSVGTLGTLTVTGTASAGSFSGAGTGLTGTASGLSIGGNAATATTASTASAVAASALTGTTLASGVVSSSLTSVGTLGALTVTGTHTQTGALNHAGTTSPIQLQGSAGTSGQVLTSAGATATPTWQTGIAASTLTGTTLASNVVASSLTSVGTLTSLQVGSGTNLGATAQIGNAATGASAADVLILGSFSTASQMRLLINRTTTGYSGIGVNAAGDLIFGASTGASAINGLTNSVYMTLASSSLNLASGVALAINGSTGTSGQVLTSSGTGSPTWAASAAAAGALTGTTIASTVTASSLTSVGTLTSLTVGGASVATGSKLAVTGGFLEIQQSSTVTTATSGAGVIKIGALTSPLLSANTDDIVIAWVTGTGANDPAGGGNGTLLLAPRNNANAGLSFVTGATARLFIANNGAWGLGSNTTYGTSGQALVSNGNAAPTWQNVSAANLGGTTLNAAVVTSSLTSVGTLSALAVTGTHTQTGALNLAGASSPLQVGGSAGTNGYVLTSAGAGLTPTWAAASGGTSNLPRVTSITSAVVGKRAAVTTAQTITATTWTGGGSIAVGDVYSIYNDSATAITLTAGSGLTLYKDGSATAVATVQLQPRGSCTIWYNTVSEAVINGSIA